MQYNHGTKLILKSVYGKFQRVVDWRKFKKKRSKRRKELDTIVAPRAILQENVIRINKILKTNLISSQSSHNKQN